jgi:alanyl-tRNA synthetase
MLGNFSFGDYFKEQAIEYAWELVTRDYGIAPERMVATVFREDDEAYGLWRDRIGLPGQRVFRLDEEENFWSMGDTGPCGPCSEIHVDFGERSECTSEVCDPSCDCGRWLEIWNLVFMQFDRDAAGAMTPLPRPSIDTGAGLERLAAVIQGVSTNYDTDLFRPIVARAEEIAGVAKGEDPEKDVSLNVVADHCRALCFLIGDGAAAHPAPRGAPRLAPRNRAPLPLPRGRRRDRRDGPRVSRAGRAPRLHHVSRRARGGPLPRDPVEGDGTSGGRD